MNFVKAFLIILFAPVVFLLFCGMTGDGDGDKNIPAYKNTELPVDERVNDLISRMTLEEKVSQMVNDAAAIDKLGIPKYNWWNECLHGVGFAGVATVFPQAIGMASMWDEHLIYEVADVISDEARAKHHEAILKQEKNVKYLGLTFWSPNINIFRDPRWGRGQETYGEDPYLTGRIAVNFIKGLQGNDSNYLKVVATAKHYAVHSGPESERHSFDAVTEDRDLYDTYLPAFETCVKEANVESIMCAYNRYDGEPCCSNKKLQIDILRNDWGFKGYIVSDCDAISDIYKGHKVAETDEEASAISVKGGCDLNCGNTYKSLLEAVKKGLITEEDIDNSLRNLFRARFKLGMFDPDDMVPYSKIPYENVDCEEHKQLALETARESMVLLKNENNILPLKKTISSIAVIGPNADNDKSILGNYNGTPSKAVTVLEGIKQAVSPDTKVYFESGCDVVDLYVDLKPVPDSIFYISETGKKNKTGIKGMYFNNMELQGKPVLERIDKNINFEWNTKSPSKKIKADKFSVRWEAKILPQVTGKYIFGLNGDDGYRLYIDDSLVVDFWEDHSPALRKGKIFLEAGREYNVKVEYYENKYDASLQLLWSSPDVDYFKKAVDIAAKSDVIIMCGGLSPEIEGEEMKVKLEKFVGGDRLDIALPDVQEELLEALYATGKPIVLVLLNGSALAVNWANEHVPAILEAWYPGQATGTAVADVLFGNYNPAGRLPVTFYKSVDQLPPFRDYSMKGRTYRYFEGNVLYPFGYGLSYTKFKYSNLVMAETIKAGEKLTVKVDVENTGSIAGDEVVQLYVKDMEASVPVPVCSLQGFKRIHLKPGEKQSVEFELKPEQYSILDNNMKRVVEPGVFEISVGGRMPYAKGDFDKTTTETVTCKLEIK